jgi:uncharacterized protein YbaP (TraB family)
MLRNFLLGLLTVLFFQANAQQTMLFEVYKPNSKNKSYLFGTMHEAHPDVYNFNDSLFWAIDKSDKAIFEMDLSSDNLKNIGRDFDEEKLFGFLIKIVDEMIDSVLPAVVNEIPANVLAQKLELMVGSLYGKVSSFGGKRLANQNKEFLDMFLFGYAKKHDKELIGLETANEQMQALLGEILSMDVKTFDMKKNIMQFLLNEQIDMGFFDEYLNASTRLLQVYHKKDYANLCDSMVNAMSGGSVFEQKYYKALFVDRNILMFERSLPHFEAGNVFMAVGAGHLCGPTGLMEAYKKAGYIVRPVNTSAKTNNKVEWYTLKSSNWSVELPKNVEIDTSAHFFYSMWMPDEELRKATLYTSKGMATFSIENESYDFEETEIDDEMWSEDWDFEDEEIVEDFDSAFFDEDFEIQEVPFEFEDEFEDEEDVEMIYLDEEDSELSEVDADYDDEMLADRYNKPNPFTIMREKTMALMENPVYAAYFMELGMALEGSDVLKNLRQNPFDLAESEPETFKLKVSKKKKLDMTLTKSYGENILSTVVETKNGTFKLSVSGDEKVLRNPEIHQFFVSFAKLNK